MQTDNYDVYESELKEFYGTSIYQKYLKNGRPVENSIKWKIPKNLLYAILAKKRNSTGEVEEVEARIKFGTEKKILKILNGHNPTQGINTAYIERSNLNRRHFNARLRRKTISFSKNYENLCAQVNLQRIHNNFCWAHHTLSPQFGCPTSPVMAIGLTKKIWSLAEVFFYQIVNIPACET